MNVVKKYGGEVLKSYYDIKELARCIAREYNPNDNLVIVVGAMSGETYRLMDLAESFSDDVPKREMDALVSIGEQQSIALLSIALGHESIPAISMTGFQSGFITTDEFGNAKIQEVKLRRITEELEKKKVVIVAGFQGVTKKGDITTFGPDYGGSDLTAVVVAAALGYDCELYKDVDGIFSVDPKLYPKARQQPYLSYQEMMELACAGANVLEPRAVEVADKFNVRLYVGKAFESDKSKGTFIMKENLRFEDKPVTGIGVVDNVLVIKIRSKDDDIVMMAAIFEMLYEKHINLDIITKQVFDDNTWAVSFSCIDENLDKILNEIKNDHRFSNMDVEGRADLVSITLVGAGMATTPGIASRAFTALSKENIHYYQVTTSEISTTVTIDKTQKMKAIIAWSEEFGL